MHDHLIGIAGSGLVMSASQTPEWTKVYVSRNGWIDDSQVTSKMIYGGQEQSDKCSLLAATDASRTIDLWTLMWSN